MRFGPASRRSSPISCNPNGLPPESMRVPGAFDDDLSCMPVSRTVESSIATHTGFEELCDVR
eukprot:scaffold20206_cov34-Tisochrysis_lutea.AAC.2